MSADSTLEKLCKELYKSYDGKQASVGNFYDDELFRDLSNTSRYYNKLDELIEPHLDELFSCNGFYELNKLDTLYISTPDGGTSCNKTQIIKGLFSSAALQIYVLQLEDEINNFTRIVLDNYQELLKAVKGENVNALHVEGIAGVKLSQDLKVTTPWGVVKTAPNIKYNHLILKPKSRCLLTRNVSIPVRFDNSFDTKITSDCQDYQKLNKEINTFLPLACILASPDLTKPVCAYPTWTSLILPIQINFGRSSSMIPRTYKSAVNVDDIIPEIEYWTTKISSIKADNIQVSQRRLVSAVSRRFSNADTLIDAVMVWENILGTKTEINFRVTASMAIMLEKNPGKRIKLMKKLKGIYNKRSRLIHGEQISEQDINNVSEEAINYAIELIREIYNRGESWTSLSSTERSEKVLLENYNT